MAIRGEGVSVVRVGELIDDNLRIPPYQRPYRWEPSTALQLLDDISDAFYDEKRSEIPYVLGAVILHQEKADDSTLNVVDGQQRLLTLKMIRAILDGADGGQLTQVTNNPVALVWNALSHRVGTWPDDRRKDIGKYIVAQCQFVQVVTDDVDEAFRVFELAKLSRQAAGPTRPSQSTPSARDAKGVRADDGCRGREVGGSLGPRP